MTETYCTATDVQLKSGTNAATLTAGEYTKLINQAEALINARMRKNLISAYSGLDDGFKLLLEDATSSRAAYVNIVSDPDSMGTAEATNLLNVNATIFNEAMAELKNQDVVSNIEDS